MINDKMVNWVIRLNRKYYDLGFQLRHADLSHNERASIEREMRSIDRLIGRIKRAWTTFKKPVNKMFA